MISHAQHSLLLFADIKEFSSRSDHAQLRARGDLYAEMQSAFTDELWRSCHHEDRGDGVLIVMPPVPALPAEALFTDVLPRLEDGLGRRRRSDPLLRLRIAVHAGPVHRDRHGFAGNAVNHVFRLCDGAPLRQALDEAGSDTAHLVSETVHDAVVRAGLPGVDPTTFHPVTVQVKETRARAYLHVPGDPACALRIARAPEPGTDGGRDDAGRGGVSVTAGHSVHMDGAIVTAGDAHVAMPPAQRRRWGRGSR
ncbi:adenylate/guanylate cyclase [Streptomyces sp. enrichment culture]|uniref:adenylate/guanylate cyclase n=1 Tax=Streptomyces sp. enrichment culture TaxID=1795815 RepID=UPI003F561605